MTQQLPRRGLAMTDADICRLSDLEENRASVHRIGGEDILLVRQGEDVFAIEDMCSHAEVSLAEGEISEGTIECWLHGSRFDLRTGEPSGPPAFEPVSTYATEIVNSPGGDRVVRLRSSSHANN